MSETELTQGLSDRQLLLLIHNDVNELRRELAELRERVSGLEEGHRQIWQRLNDGQARMAKLNANIEMALIASAGALDRVQDSRAAKALRGLVDKLEDERGREPPSTRFVVVGDEQVDHDAPTNPGE